MWISSPIWASGLMILSLLEGPLGQGIFDLFRHCLDDERRRTVPVSDIEGRAHRCLDSMLLLRGGGHRVFECGDPALEVDVLLASDLLEDLSEVDFLLGVLCAICTQQSKAS